MNEVVLVSDKILATSLLSLAVFGWLAVGLVNRQLFKSFVICASLAFASFTAVIATLLWKIWT